MRPTSSSWTEEHLAILGALPWAPALTIAGGFLLTIGLRYAELRHCLVRIVAFVVPVAVVIVLGTTSTAGAKSALTEWWWPAGVALGVTLGFLL